MSVIRIRCAQCCPRCARLVDCAPEVVGVIMPLCEPCRVFAAEDLADRGWWAYVRWNYPRPETGGGQ